MREDIFNGIEFLLLNDLENIEHLRASRSRVLCNCVADGANKASLAALLPQNAPTLLKNLAGNDFASLQQLALGPNRAGAAISVAEGKGTNAVAQGIGTLAWGADRFILGTNGAGTT